MAGGGRADTAGAKVEQPHDRRLSVSLRFPPLAPIAAAARAARLVKAARLRRR